MWKKIAAGIVAALVLFLGYVATRPSFFKYERSTTYQATPDKIFPYLVSFQKGNEWSPYSRVDPNMKFSFKGTEGEVGSIMEFEGNSEAGTGRLEMLKIIPNETVEIRLVMTKPVPADNVIRYQLEPAEGGTKFTWTMEGDGGFLGKLIGVLIDCEKMLGEKFEQGFQNLRPLVEKI